MYKTKEIEHKRWFYARLFETEQKAKDFKNEIMTKENIIEIIITEGIK